MKNFPCNPEEIEHIKLLRQLTVLEYEMILDLTARTVCKDEGHEENFGFNVVPIFKPAA